MSLHSKFREFVILWNNSFPLDHWWREKHHIAFNSEKHREVNQIDIYFEWLEERLYNQRQEEVTKEVLDRQEYKNKGIWLKKQEPTSEEADDLFNKIDVEDIDFSKIEITD